MLRGGLDCRGLSGLHVAIARRSVPPAARARSRRVAFGAFRSPPPPPPPPLHCIFPENKLDWIKPMFTVNIGFFQTSFQ
jgi:hypothetical protein